MATVPEHVLEVFRYDKVTKVLSSYTNGAVGR